MLQRKQGGRKEGRKEGSKEGRTKKPSLVALVEADVMSYLRGLAVKLGIEVVGPFYCPLHADAHPALQGRCEFFHARHLQQCTGSMQHLLSISILGDFVDKAQDNLFCRIAARNRRYQGSARRRLRVMSESRL